MAAKQIKGSNKDKIFGAIKLTNQKQDIRDNPLLIIRSIYFKDLDNQTKPVNTNVIIKKGLNILKKIYFINVRFKFFIFI